MANGYGSSSTPSTPSTGTTAPSSTPVPMQSNTPPPTQSTTNEQGQVAPPGFHYMPDGTLMSDVEHARLYSAKTIETFDLDLSDIPAAGEIRNFTILGSNNAEFILEIKDNTTGYYYNFTTNTFLQAQARLEKSITGGSYKGTISFPAVTGSSDQYDIYLYAKPGTKHVQYSEIRFADGTVDINSSKGSKSLMMQKVVYQYAAITLTLQGHSPNSTITGTFNSTSLTLDRGKSKNTTPFTLTATATPATCYEIKKQLTGDDISSKISLTLGSTPEALPGEDIYPTATAAFTGDDVNGAITSGSVVRIDGSTSANITVGDKITSPTTSGTVDGAVEEAQKIVLDQNVATLMAVGDRVTGSACDSCNTQIIEVEALNPDGDNVKEFSITSADSFADGGTLTFSSKVNRSLTTVTVVATSSTDTDFTMSQAIQFRDDQPLTFSKQKNKRWPVSDINKIQAGNRVISGGDSSADLVQNSSVSNYLDTIVQNENTESEKIIIRNQAPAVDTKGQKPTITNGVVTLQPGNVIFDNQQVLSIANGTVNFIGDGVKSVSKAYGYDFLLTDLKVTLTPVTTTTTSAVSDSTTVPVASVNGILPSISSISGIGIDPSTLDPIVNSRSVTSGAGDLELSAAQTLESGVTLTSVNAGQVATITGNIEILKAGTSSETIFFDLEKILKVS